MGALLGNEWVLGGTAIGVLLVAGTVWRKTRKWKWRRDEDAKDA